MSSSSRIGADGGLTGSAGTRRMSVPGGNSLAFALHALLGGNDADCVKYLHELSGEDIERAHNVLGGLQAKLVAAAAIGEVKAMLAADGTVHFDAARDDAVSAALSGSVAPVPVEINYTDGSVPH